MLKTFKSNMLKVINLISSNILQPTHCDTNVIDPTLHVLSTKTEGYSYLGICQVEKWQY